MDAGVAAVLGAAVGALGTGGAGVAAALISRSQGRLQLRAEYRRMIREPRKAAYVAVAELTIRSISHLRFACAQLSVMAEDGTLNEESVRETQTQFDNASGLDEALAHATAVVDVEGPHDVRVASTKMALALIQLRKELALTINRLGDGEVPSVERARHLQELHSAAHSSHTDFLIAAHRAIEDDGIMPALG